MADEMRTSRLNYVPAAAAVLLAAASDLVVLLRFSYGIGWILAGLAVACWFWATRRSVVAMLAGCVVAVGHGGLLAWKVMAGGEAFFGVTTDPIVTACVWLGAAGLFATLLLFEATARRFSR